MIRLHGFRSLLGCATLAALLLSAVGCSPRSSDRSSGYRKEGIASYYAHKFHGRTTASGEVYDENRMTAAHRELPFGTRVRVTNLSNDKHVVLKINDRGPFVDGRIIDVSYAAAKRLDFIEAGIVRVRVEQVD